MDAIPDYASQFMGHLHALDSFEKERSNALTELKRSYLELLGQHQELRELLEEERASTKLWQREFKKTEKLNETLEVQLSLAKTANTTSNASNSFVFAIIDGDGAVFREDFIAKGVDGGEEAAHLLHKEIANHIKAIQPDASVDRIMVQIVLNLDSLSRAFHASNVLRYNDLSGFAIGFCRAQPLFSIVDVGAGKEQADQKVRKMFEVMQSDTHCKHIVFGGCHDNGYAPFLRPYSGDPEVASKITLLETARLGAEFYNLNFGRVKFDGVFRTENIPSRTLPSNDQPVALRAVKDATPPAAPARVTSPAVSVISTVDMDGTWASVGRNGAIAKMIDIGSKKYARRYVQVNKKEQRIDCKLPPPEPAAHRRIQEAMRANSANYCNRYHLLSNCPSTGEYCQFVHGDRLVGVELNVLRNMARGILCHDMSRCRDVTCVLGHHCRTPNNCTFGAKCRFRESHNMDQAVVLKIYEDGTTELAR